LFVQTTFPDVESLRPDDQPALHLRSEDHSLALVLDHERSKFVVDQATIPSPIVRPTTSQ
jgi:hypothetical protein